MVNDGSGHAAAIHAKWALDFDDGNSSASKKLAHIPCNGVLHNDLQARGLSLPEQGLASLREHLSLIHGHWHHRDCFGFIVDFKSLSAQASADSCRLCVAARSSVRAGRVPDLLFLNGLASMADIAHSNDRLPLEMLLRIMKVLLALRNQKKQSSLYYSLKFIKSHTLTSHFATVHILLAAAANVTVR